jgi:hypothetical protein
MKLKYIATCAGLIASSVLAFSNAPAQAFSFTTNFSGNNPKRNILLDSVKLTDGSVINNFALVNRANIISNDLWTGGNTGAASADMGDQATIGTKQERLDNNGAVAALGNLNLNSIIDTEDSGRSVIDVFFSSAVDNLFFWERGMNSKLDIQALDAKGRVIGNLLTSYSGKWQYAGYGIDTKEISETQRVGSLGISLADLGVANPIFGVRVASRGAAYNGPDWKVAGSATSVPEPATLAGLGLVAGAIATSRRRRASNPA